MKTKSLFISIFSIFCVIGLLLNSGAVYAQGEGEPTPASNTAPTIILTEPQQNITIQTGEKVSIAWTDDDPDDNATIGLAYDVDSDPTNDDPIHWIAQNLAEDADEDGDRFEWDTTGIPAGTYYIWAVISDSVNAPTYALAAGSLTILEAQAPTQKPTEEPTALPTEEPMQVPTEEPTAIPTQEPTEIPTVEPTQTPTSEPTDESKFSWKLELIDISSQSETYNAVVNGLESEGAQLDLESNGITLQGTKNLQELRNVLYSDLDGIISMIGGAAKVDVQIPITDTKPIIISLESNLSTGYRWFVSSATIDEQAIDYSESYLSREGIGVPYIQTITLQPPTDGTALIHLSYVRLFENNESMTRRLTLQMDTDTSIIDLSDPNPATFSESAYESESGDKADISSLMPEAVDNAETLPSSFDWRNYGGTTPIRDQKTCGSCWAFATVGTMESAMAIKTGKYFDLSEQFLVSCNKDGWSCAGGGTAHSYHYNKLGKNQTAIGAVLEADKPYTNSNGTCTTAYNHPYLLSSWSTISSTTVANLKNAIYTYGPIKVSICAGPKFQSYTGGVFTTDESSYCSSTNHAVILVGWNDATGSWILRNSWGTGWGESGYMRIQYGISRVGTNASWVTFAANTTPTLSSPSGNISDTTPTYTWTKVGGARKYQYQLYQDTTLIYAKTVSSSVCGSSTCSSTPTDVLTAGNYQWRVGAYMDGEWKDFSAYKSFAITFTPTPKTPSGTITDNTPTYTWSKIGTATKYQYQLYKEGVLVYAKTVTSSACGTSSCSSTPTNILNGGEYQWKVGAYVDGAWRTFSSNITFILNLTPTPGAPSGVITDNTPTYTWTKVSSAAKYMIQLFKGSTTVYSKTITPDACGTSTCTNTPSNILGSGDYQWRVGAYVNGAWQSFSTYQTFTMSFTPTIVSPNNTTSDTTPTYTWSKVSAASKYMIQLYKDTTLVYSKTITTSACSTSTCTSTPTNILDSGDYRWRAGAYVNGAWQSFSTYQAFTISLTPTPSSPTGTITDTTPTYTWSKLSTATKYQYQLYKNNTLVYAKTVASSVCGTTSCSDTPTTALSAGNYQWRIGAYIDSAWKTFSARQDFAIDTPVVPTPSSPNGTITDSTPSYSWSIVSGATSYQYQLYQGTTLIYTKIVPSDVCGSTTCTSTPTDSLNAGPYQWQVAANVDGMWKAFSSSSSFVVNLTPTPASPSGTIYDKTPTYSWSKIDSATSYQYQLYSSGSLIYSNTASSSTCSGSTCSHTPTTRLSTGNYTWHVSAYVDGNWQTVSSDLSFATAAGFNSQFTSDAEGWSPVAGSWTVENGYYKGTRNSTTSYFFSSAYDELFTSLTYEVRLQTSANMSMGLHFRGYSAPLSSSSRWDSGYYFYVYNNIYSIGYFENGQYTAIKNGSWSNGYTWTTLKVIANGSSIQLYINGTQVESFTNETRFSAGKVGVEFYADTTTSANMYIDWATLTT